MKRILFCVLLSFMTYSARAESWMLFSAAAVEDSINTMVEPEYRAATADEYEKQMDSTNGKITASGILSVCATAGWAINTDEGFYFCRGFVDNIAELSGVSSNAAKQCKQMNGIRTVLDDGSNQCIGRDGTVLVYSDACRGGDGECVEFFADLRTQVPNALEFIYEYGKSNNLEFTCSNEIVDIHKIGSDYIKCSANKTAYEFKFDTLNQSYNRRMVDSENAALCKMFGGTVAGTDDYWTMCDMERAKCDKLATFAPTIGHSAMYQGSCRISRTVNTRDNIFLNHIDGVDSYVFYDVKIRSGVAKPMLEQYLTSIFPEEEYITCDSDIVELNDPTSLGTNWIMQCTVGTQQVDFIFDELAEKDDFETDAGIAQMACVIQGGIHSGKSCRGLNEPECLDVSTQIPGGTTWDEKTQSCILNDAKQAETLRNVRTVVNGIVITVATLGIGGYVNAAYSIAAVVGSVAFDAAFFGLQRLQEVYPHHIALQFTKDTYECDNATCAMLIVQTYFNRLNDISEYLTDEELDVIATQIDKVSGILTDDEFEEAMQNTVTNFGDFAMNASTPLLFAVGLFAAPENVMLRFTSKAPRFAARVARMSDNALAVANKSSALSRYGAVLRRGAENSLGYDYYRIMINGANSDVSRIITELQQEGFYISSNITTSGNRFLAVSDRNIFSAWDNNPNNWLRFYKSPTVIDFGSDIATKSGRSTFLRRGSARGYDYYRVDIKGLSRNQVQQIMDNLRSSGYDDVFIMRAGDDFVLSVSNPSIRGGKNINNSGIQQYGLDQVFGAATPQATGSNAEKIRQILAAGDRTAQYRALGRIAFSPQTANQLINEITSSITSFIGRDRDLIYQIRNWNRLDLEMKKSITAYLNYNIAGLRRTHRGDTIINFGSAIDNPHTFAHFRAQYGDIPKEYAFNFEGPNQHLANADFEKVLDSIIHENIHSWQYNGTSSIAPEFIQLREQLYTRELYDRYYKEDLLELETFYVAPTTARNVIRNLGL